ncbi:helix-turn-helix domain-containing protein [Streptomyces arenae]|uniref:helix-turn-helix domain-containing protein n=1 Tax=Streptomyces arenae TaxID=29301 RepID=UPI002658F166|nr:helix-turn-helix transcriptional regulator [Streptomyces arenae]MCG7206437.1 helix-turn-helix domain-containing protein [Streptomyces arenae]
MRAWDGHDRGKVSVRDDVEEFAALLRQLKDRTDRSYGSLARRLNMNTSTLHRYCAGEAVPLDFAPVERLAAFCGATPRERLELHERWLRAVAARQRPRGTDAEQPPAAPAREARPEHATEAGAGSAAGPGAEMEADAEPMTEVDAASVVEAGAESMTEVDAASVVEAGAESVVRPVGVGGAGAAEAPGGSRRWYRRRRTLVAAAVATVLLSTLGTLAALPDDPPPADAAARHPGSAAPTTAAGDTGRREAAASTGPAAAPTSATPSPSPSPSGARPSASRSGGATPTAQAPTGVPLTWTANSQLWDLGCDHDYVIDKQPAQVPPPPAPQDAGTWAATQNAVHGGDTIVEVSVQGRSSTAVVLEDLRVRVVGRTAPAPGIAYSMADGCGGGLTPRYFDVNLDKDRPIARPVAGEGPDGKTVSTMHLPYRVSATDPEVLRVQANTVGCDCRWYLELDWSSQGRSGTVRVDDHGQPFRTSSIKGLPHYWYGFVDGVRQWVPTVG